MNILQKNVLVTGATSGIGLTTAKLLTESGYRVIATGRKQEVLDTLRDSNLVTHCLKADLAQAGETARVVNETLKLTNGELYGLVHAAGILVPGSIENETEEGFEYQLNVNLNSSFRLLHYLWPSLKSAKGSAVFVSSVTGLRAFPNLVGYCVSKAGVDQLVRCAALEGAPDGIRVNAVNPGVVVTELHKRGGMEEKAYETFLEHSKTTHPMGRVGKPEEIANAIAFLLSSENGWITGVNLPIDGGRQLTCNR